MSGYVTLMGAEDVSRAAGRMSEAAHEMSRAAGTISDAMDRNRMFLDDWLARLESVLREARGAP